MNAYEQVAYDSAVAQELAAADVRAMGYAEIAALAEVELGPGGESPDDFFYVHVRNAVAQALQANADSAKHARQKAALEAAVEYFSDDLHGLTVFDAEDGGFRIQ